MTEDELLRAAVLDARAAYAAYDTYSTDELVHVLFGHELDQGFARTPEDIAFGAGRLALIKAVLAKRRDERPSSSLAPSPPPPWGPDPRD